MARILRRWRHRVRFAVGVAIACVSTLVRALGAEIVLAEDSGQYQEAVTGVERELAGRADVRRLDLDAFQRLSRADSPRPAVRVALGTRAFEAVLARGDSTPVIATLLPRAAYERVLRAYPRTDPKTVSAVYLDQPYARQLALIRLALPGRTRVGVLTPPESSELATIQAAALTQRFTVAREVVSANSEVYQALRRLLDESDVLLATPESTIYNAATLHNVLATTFRAQVPVIGFSPAYVRAGALAAVHSSPAQLGQQAGQLAQRALAGGATSALPAAQYPRVFMVTVNQAVARSLDLATPDGPTLTTKLTAAERE